MAFTDEYQLQEELEVFARNQDILTTTERGVTTTTDTLTATGSDTFTLSQTRGVRNIRFVTVAGTTKSSYREFTPTYTSGTITMSGVATSSEVVVNYDYGPRDTIYGELPQEIVDRLSLPRMMVKDVTPETSEFALGGGANITDRLITFQVWSTTIKRIHDVTTNVRTAVLSNKKNFYHFPFITVLGRGNIRTDYTEQDETFAKNVDCMARFEVERV